MGSELALYSGLLSEIKERIRQAQTRAALSANAEMIAMYWDIGRIILHRQQMEGWGAGIIPRLVVDLKNDLPEVKGFSERNIGYMIRFAREYGVSPILQQPAAKLAEASGRAEKVPQAVAKLAGMVEPVILQQLAAKIPRGHNILLMEKVKDPPTRRWYMEQTIEEGGSRTRIHRTMVKAAHASRKLTARFLPHKTKIGMETIRASHLTGRQMRDVQG
jgi:predicted nuclease of restriction endonuclease-like (RecB) superfamily